MEQFSIAATVMRGGTSKGVFLKKVDFEAIPEGRRDQAILSIFGSPDARQVDGLGGATSTTSKLMVVGASKQPGVDVEYTFGQVAVDKPRIDYGGNCGNLTAAVGVFALLEKLAKAVEPTTVLTLYNTNTKKRIVAEIPVEGGMPRADGDFRIQGVPGTGAKITNRYLDPAGGVTGKLLPTGNRVDIVHADAKQYRCSILDVINPVVFVLARDLGLSGAELPEELSGKPGLLSTLERIRGEVAQMLGIVADGTKAAFESPGIPKISLVAGPVSYSDSTGAEVRSEQVNVLGRMLSMQKPHPAYAVTGAMCTAVAAVLAGTIVNEVARFGPGALGREAEVVIGHPRGTIAARVKIAATSAGNPEVEEAVVYRTARVLIRGTAFYRA